MNYTNREVVRRLKQYDMFLNSLNLTTDEMQKDRICDQLDKIEKQILLETNTEYEEQYMLLLGEEAKFFSEEKSRLHKLISLISERKNYLNDRKKKHKDITGSLVELTTFLGEDKLNVFKKKLNIIEKYEENKNKQESLIKEMKMLDIKLSEASRTVKANARLNDILENKMISAVSKAIDKLNLYPLTGRREEILRNYDNLEYVLNIAKDNLKSAKKIGDESMIFECDEMLSEISSEYSRCNENVNILRLIDIYENSVNGYDELLEKREKINEILKNITDSQLYSEISEELNKEYNTIKLEKQDIDNYEFLKQDRERKNKLLYEIDEENNSKEFKIVIDELVKNENRVREEKIRKAKKEEYQERQKKLLEEQKIEASRVKRQKLIEEAKLKEQQERFEKVKELQERTVINSKKEEKVAMIKEEMINNPLKDKSFDGMMNLSNDFDTDELFENTKIVPNKVVNEEKSLFDKIEENSEEVKSVLEDSSLMASAPVLNDSNVLDETAYLFKENEKAKEITFDEKNEELSEYAETNDMKPSIYDILENNKNIVWRSTDTDINKDTIPVIGNNNLKPEILDNKKVDDLTFPKLDGIEGEVLWKETL